MSPAAGAALALVVVEALLALGGARVPALSAAVLVLAPGLALLPLLPRRFRASSLGAVACAPALGFAASSVALITVARVGIPLGALSARVTVAVIVLAGALALRHRDVPSEAPSPLEALALLLVLTVGSLLIARTIGGSPVPGNDWGKYLLYIDEIRHQGSLLIRNPFWMLGQPFREDPGVPAVLGPFAAMVHAGPATLTHGIWLFALVPVLSLFGYVRAYWGPLAAVVAAALWAVLPINQDMLSWHGLPNVAALGLIPLLMAYVGAVASTRLAWPEAGGGALLVVALAATHRLSFVAAAAGLGLGLVVLGVRGADRGALVRNLARIAALLVPLGAGVVADLLARNASSGGTQPYTAYLSTKLDLLGAVLDLTIPFSVAAVLALALLAHRRMREKAILVPVCLLGALLGLAYAWTVHVPAAYNRMAFYLPLALVPLVAVVLVRFARPRAAVALTVVLVSVVGAFGWTQDDHARRFYAFTNAASLRGLDALAQRLRPGEVVATDRCWSFLSTWLLQTRTLAALESADIGPPAELRVARQARGILDYTPAGRRTADRLGVRYFVVDPFCSDAPGRPAKPPQGGRLVYLSTRLAIFAR